MIIKDKLYSECEKEYKNLYIYLPDEYYTTDEQYPVMYFFDGHNLFDNEDATYGKSWGLKEFMQTWEKPMIIVGVECSHKGDHRLSEYCPYPVQAFGSNIHGDGKATMDWIVDVLKPYIDKNLRTYPFREATAIGGSSMGGLMSVYAVGVYNHIFSKAACLSSSTGIVMDRLFEDIRRIGVDPDTRVYLSWGEFEGGQCTGDPEEDSWGAHINHATADLFEEYGATTRVYFQRGGHHCEADWEKQDQRFMDFLWLDR